MKVKCINAGGTQGELELDKIYEVMFKNAHNYGVVGATTTMGWMKHRFLVVDESVSPIAAVKPSEIKWNDIGISPAIKQAITSKKVDAEEEKCWRAMRPVDPPGYCPCGTHKSVCWIHKD
jgi:hypothetical protein